MKNNEAILIAFNKGYSYDELGNIYGPKGNLKILNIRKDGYKTFSVRCERCMKCIKVHRFIAYNKYKNELFKEGIIVRHLDGDPLNNSYNNILIGTHSDNAMDISKYIRQTRAKYANRKYSDEFIDELRSEYALGSTYKILKQKYNIPKATLSYYLSKTAKKLQVNISS